MKISITGGFSQAKEDIYLGALAEKERAADSSRLFSKDNIAEAAILITLWALYGVSYRLLVIPRQNYVNLIAFAFSLCYSGLFTVYKFQCYLQNKKAVNKAGFLKNISADEYLSRLEKHSGSIDQTDENALKNWKLLQLFHELEQNSASAALIRISDIFDETKDHLYLKYQIGNNIEYCILPIADIEKTSTESGEDEFIWHNGQIFFIQQSEKGKQEKS